MLIGCAAANVHRDAASSDRPRNFAFNAGQRHRREHGELANFHILRVPFTTIDSGAAPITTVIQRPQVFGLTASVTAPDRIGFVLQDGRRPVLAESMRRYSAAADVDTMSLGPAQPLQHL